MPKQPEAKLTPTPAFYKEAGLESVDIQNRIEVTPILDWMVGQEVADHKFGFIEPVDQVARIDAALQYLDRKKRDNFQNAAVVERGVLGLENHILRKVKESGDLISDLSEDPIVSNGQNIPGIIIKAQAMRDVRRRMSDDGLTYAGARKEAYEQLLEERNQFINLKLHSALGPAVNPERYYEYTFGPDGERDGKGRDLDQYARDASRNAAQLELLFHSASENSGGNLHTDEVLGKAFAYLVNNEGIDTSIRGARLQNLVNYLKMPHPDGPGMHVITIGKILEANGIGIVSEAGPSTSVPKIESGSVFVDNVSSIRIKKARVAAERSAQDTATINNEIESLNEKNKDPEHVHFHRFAIVIPDIHGYGPEVIHDAIVKAYGDKHQVDFSTGVPMIGNEEVTVYQSGDLIDANKKMMKFVEVSAHGYKNWKDFIQALERTAPKSERAAVRLENLRRHPKLAEAMRENFALLEKGEPNSKESTKDWIDAIEEGKVTWGNHEAMMMGALMGDVDQLLVWLCDTNKGSMTVKDFTGFDVEEWLGERRDNEGKKLHNAYKALLGMTNQQKAELRDIVRQKLLDSSEFMNLAKALKNNAKLYNIINGQLVVHAGIPVDPRTGELTGYIFSESSRKALEDELGADAIQFFAGLEGLKGIEGLDYIEKAIRDGSNAAIRFMGASSSKENEGLMNPLSVREPFHDAMRNHGKKVLAQLTEQTKTKGMGIKVQGILVGHTPSGGAIEISPQLRIMDNDFADGVRLEIVEVSEGTAALNIGARAHQFGKDSSLKIRAVRV